MNFSKDKHIIIPVCLALAAIIGYRSWYDMHPPPKPPPPLFDTFRLVRDDKTMEAVIAEAENTLAVVVWAGDFRTDKDGKFVLQKRPVTPATLPQREVILLYTMDQVPKSPEMLATDLVSTSQKWKEQGDMINDLYLEAADNKGNLATLIDKSSDIRHSLHSDYFLGIFAGSKTLEALPDRQKRLAEASKSVRSIIFNAKEAFKPGEDIAALIRRLDKGELPFLLEVAQLPDFVKLQRQLQPEPQRFIGFLLDAGMPDKAAP